MYVRISRAAYKPEHADAVKDIIGKLEKDFDKIPGMQHWVCVLTGKELVVMGYFPDRAACKATEHVNTQRWDAALHLFKEQPHVTEGEVLAFVSK